MSQDVLSTREGTFSNMKRVVVAILVVVVLTQFVIADVEGDALRSGKKKEEKCEAPFKRGRVCKIKLEDIRPTQNSIGGLAVECKVEKLKKKKLEKYIDTHELDVVIGPKDTFYLIDGHHRASSIMRLAQTTDIEIRVRVKEDLSHLPDMHAFWRRMELSKWVWTMDRMGRPVEPRDLPHTLDGLNNDPFRTLAFLLREYGYYEKSDFAPFAEFYWSDYMRMFFGSYQCVIGMSKKDEVKWLQEITKLAGKVAKDENAAFLPGWGKGKKRDLDCSLFDKEQGVELFAEDEEPVGSVV